MNKLAELIRSDRKIFKFNGMSGVKGKPEIKDKTIRRSSSRAKKRRVSRMIGEV